MKNWMRYLLVILAIFIILYSILRADDLALIAVGISLIAVAISVKDEEDE